MVKILQIVATIIVFGVVPIVWADYYSENKFIDHFMKNQSLSIMGTILAIYIATAASFLAIIMGYEKTQKEVIFNGTSAEIKQNIKFIIVVFVLHLFLLALTPSDIEKNQNCVFFLRSASVLTFLLYIYSLYEMSDILFGIRKILNKKS